MRDRCPRVTWWRIQPYVKLQIELQIAVVGAKETVRHMSVAVQAQEHEHESARVV